MEQLYHDADCNIENLLPGLKERFDTYLNKRRTLTPSPKNGRKSSTGLCSKKGILPLPVAAMQWLFMKRLDKRAVFIVELASLMTLLIGNF